jgi:hypothetical protein
MGDKARGGIPPSDTVLSVQPEGEKGPADASQSLGLQMKRYGVPAKQIPRVASFEQSLHALAITHRGLMEYGAENDESLGVVEEKRRE